ncbi:MAG: hypothetical protein H7835_03520 [Magnetococcus sp. XQGC-1]
MAKIFGEAVSELVAIASYVRSLPDPSKNLWSMVVDHLKASEAIDLAFRAPVEQMIEHYVRKQVEDAERGRCAKKTEPGTLDREEGAPAAHGPCIQSIGADLASHLFEAFMEQARQESTEAQSRTQ